MEEKRMEEKKLFVGGYYDDIRICCGWQSDRRRFCNKIDTYTLDEALKLGFVENVVEWYNESNDMPQEEFDEDGDLISDPTIDEPWDLTTFEEKVEAILDYTGHDSLAGMLYFNTEEEAEKHKQEALEQIQEIEDAIDEGKLVFNGNFNEREYNYSMRSYVHIECHELGECRDY